MASSNQPKLMLTKNFQQLKEDVASHVAADVVRQGSYTTCFIGCLANNTDDPKYIENTYGIPVMVSRLSESIFEGLPSDEAPAFFGALPAAVRCDGKDLSRVPWQFLSSELRSLPKMTNEIQAVISPVIAGMDLLVEGKEWPEAHAATAAGYAAANAAYYSALLAAGYAALLAAANAASAAKAASAAGYAAANAAKAASAAGYAAANAADATDAAAKAADATDAAAKADVRRRQRDLLLRLIKEAPVVGAEGE